MAVRGQLLKKWTDWESGIGYLPDDYSHGDDSSGIYFANGIIGMHGELRPAPFFRTSTLKSHISRRVYKDNVQASAIALQIPNAVQGTQPTVASFASKAGATSSAAAASFFVGSFDKTADANTVQTITHGAGFEPEGIMFWSADGELGDSSADAVSRSAGSNTIGFTDRTFVTGTDIAFVDGGGGADTITSAGNAFGVFSAGDIIHISGSSNNPATRHTVVSATAGVITLATASIANENAGTATTITKGNIAISWNAENNAGDPPTQVVQGNLDAGSSLGEVQTISRYSDSTATYTNPTPFSGWGPWLNLFGGKMNIITITSSSAISNSDIPVLTLAGATITLIRSIKFSTTNRMSVYFSAPQGGTVSGWSNVTWQRNQTDASMQKVAFNNVVITGVNGADGIVQSAEDSDPGGAVNVHLNPLNQTGNAMWGACMMNQTSGVISTGSGFTKLSSLELDLGPAETQHQFRIDSAVPSNPFIDWTIPAGPTAKMIGIELAAEVDATDEFETNIYTPHDNRLVIFTVDSHVDGGNANFGTVTGNNMTWTLINTLDYDSGTRNISMYKALVTSGAATGRTKITFSPDHDDIRWAVTEFANVNLAVGGGAAVEQTSSTEETSNTTTPSHTLDNAITAGNAVFGAFAVNNTSSITKGTDFEELFEVPAVSSSLMTQIDANGGDQVVDATGSSGKWAIIGVEIEFVAEGSAATNTSRAFSDVGCIYFVGEDVDSFTPYGVLTDVNGSTDFKIQWYGNTGVSSPDAINYMMFGGTEIKAKVLHWSNSILQETQSIEGAGFKPAFIMNIGALTDTVVGATGHLTATGATSILGMASGGSNQFAQVWRSPDSIEPSSTTRRQSQNYIMVDIGATQSTVLDSLDTDGFTVNHTQPWGTVWDWGTLCLSGVTAEVGQFTRDIDTGGQTATSIAIESDAFILSSALTTSNDLLVNGSMWAMGASSELTEAAASCWVDKDGAAPTNSNKIDWKQDSATTIANGEDLTWVELGVTDGVVNVLAGVAGMDIGADNWLFLEDPDLASAMKINYAGFTAASDPAFSTDSFDATSSDSNVELIVAIATANGAPVTSVTFNENESLTQIAGDSSTTDTTLYALEIWHLTNPTDSDAAIIVTTDDVVDIIVGVYLVEGASSDFASGTFVNNSMSAKEYFTASVDFSQPAVSSSQTLFNKDLILGVSVDNSAIGESADASTTDFDDNTAPVPDTLDDSGEAFNVNEWKGYLVTASTTKTSMIVDTNTATKFSGFKYGGWTNGVPSPDDSEGWELSGTSCSSLETPIIDVYKTNMHMLATYLDTPYHQWQAHYYFEEVIGTDDQYLYVSRGHPISDVQMPPEDIADPPVLVSKISLRNADFGTDLGIFEFPDLSFPGQVARYQSNWHLPASGQTLPRKLTVGTGDISNDFLSGLTDTELPELLTAEHLMNRGIQVGGARSTTEDVPSGMRILIVNGDPGVEADWAQYFEVGDKHQRPAGLASVAGLDFLLNKDGLWSFISDDEGFPLGTSLVFEDFKIWRSLFENVPISPWKGGLLIPHPSGFLFWIPGQQPTNIGFDGRVVSFSDPPPTVTNFKTGRYLGCVGVGDYIYTLYQPDITSVAIYVLCGYLGIGGKNTSEIIWQSLGRTFLYSPNYNANIGVSLLGRPISEDYETPSLWFNNGNNLNYILLDSRGGPFRVQKTTLMGDVYLSELFFPDMVDMTEMIVYTQGMRRGDTWQLSIFADDQTEVNVGAPISQNGRNVIRINRHNIYRAMFRWQWEASSSSNLTSTTMGIDISFLDNDTVVGSDIAFVDGGGGADTITSAASAFGIFSAGDSITVTGAGESANNTTYTIVSVVDATITLATATVTAESASETITIQGPETPDTITSASSVFGDFVADDVITVKGSSNNDNVYTLIEPVSSGVLTVSKGSLTTESAGSEVVIHNQQSIPSIKRMELYGNPVSVSNERSD